MRSIALDDHIQLDRNVETGAPDVAEQLKCPYLRRLHFRRQPHFRRQMAIAGDSPFLFPSDLNQSGHQTTFKTIWHKTLRRAKVPYFRIYDLRPTYATRLSAGGVADEWVTQMRRQGDAQVFKKYSQMKLQMKREALERLNRRASEMLPASGESIGTVTVQ